MSAHVEQQRRRIVAEAMRMVSEGGAASVTIRDLARRLGMAPANLYSHFRSKDDLLREVAREGFDRLMASAADATQIGDARKAIAEAARRYLDFAVAHPALYRLMFGEDVTGQTADASLQLPGRAVFELYRELFTRAVSSRASRRIDPDLQTVIGWSAIHGFALLTLSGRIPPRHLGRARREEIREGFIGFLVDSLRP